MKTSEQTDKIDEVIALVQAEIEQVTKDKIVDVKTREGGDAWKSGYATLAALDAAARPALKKHGVAVYQGGGFVQGLGPTLETRLAYQGQWIESFYPVKTSRDGAQGFGGGISFGRRWGLCGMLGLVPHDAEEGEGFKAARLENKAPRRGAAPGGLAPLLEAIRSSETLSSFEQAARAARGAHPSGDASAAVEKAITTRFVVSVDNADTPDKLALCRTANERIQPRGTEVRDALGRADRRMRGEV